jgi:hypothetical protein
MSIVASGAILVVGLVVVLAIIFVVWLVVGRNKRD